MMSIKIKVSLPKNYALIVGKIITLFAYAEWLPQDTAFQLLGIDQIRGRLALKEFRASEYPELWKQACNLRGLSHKFDLDDMKGNLESSEANRNMFAHSIWLEDTKTAKTFIKITRGNWPKSPRMPKISKKVHPEIRPINLLYLHLVLRHMQAVVKMTEATRDALLLLLEEPQLKSHGLNPRTNHSPSRGLASLLPRP